ncbi:hypothetical protein GC096_06095 [Paenibacillus sp. LMG 31461]|uniref:N-sulphoglucosamine sulphohydrolase C-terminal domain-containing protein n=2 Tax=Paenibacillus plantarum TaxID=2654975 RepID=A0ABX1X5K9_9BACL|nr:hypothetical protein [Paenibacillus plantarum]
MLMRWPASIPQGVVVDKFVSVVDFQQTMAGLMGVAASGKEQGSDASPFLRGEDPAWKGEVFV